MRFALLNVDAELLSLAKSLAAAGHELMLAVRPAEWEPALRSIAPRIRLLYEWEGVLACGADAVLLGRTGPDADRLERDAAAVDAAREQPCGRAGGGSEKRSEKRRGKLGFRQKGGRAGACYRKFHCK